jgi:hypothetical protein
MRHIEFKNKIGLCLIFSVLIFNPCMGQKIPESKKTENIVVRKSAIMVSSYTFSNAWTMVIGYVLNLFGTATNDLLTCTL